MDLQAASCERAGSFLYGSLLCGLRDDAANDGVTARLLTGVSERPVHDALPLRYLATAHRLALDGMAPDLASFFASCGGSWAAGPDRAPLVASFLKTVDEHRPEFAEGVRRNVQTNEVGRAAVLAAGFCHIAQTYRLPLRTLELGGSAGLLSRWMHYRYDTGAAERSVCGDEHSGLRFDHTWFRAPSPPLDPHVEIIEARSSDISPLDMNDGRDRLTLLSFLWPDQVDRRDRMLTALEIARHHPKVVEASDAGAWLERQLIEQIAGDFVGTATVVFHAIVWQYLPDSTRTRIRRTLESAARRATDRAPLCWLRMEPAGPANADLRLTAWPGGHEHVLAHVGYHGADVRWLHRAGPPLLG